MEIVQILERERKRFIDYLRLSRMTLRNSCVRKNNVGYTQVRIVSACLVPDNE